jgi:hypothetical protein
MKLFSCVPEAKRPRNKVYGFYYAKPVIPFKPRVLARIHQIENNSLVDAPEGREKKEK